MRRVGTRKNGPQENWSPRKIVPFHTHTTMLDAHPTIFRFWVSRGPFFSGTIFPETIFPGTIFPEIIFPGTIFFGDHFSEDHFSRDHFSGDHFSRGPFFWGPFFPRTIFPGTIFLGDHFSGDHFSRGPFFRDSPGYVPKTANFFDSTNFFITEKFYVFYLSLCLF